MTKSTLGREYEEMVDYFEIPPNPEYTEVTDGVWQYEDSDICWGYVSIGSEGELEAVIVAMTQESEDRI